MPLNLLIKPASGCCDLRCRYCFYRDEMTCREIPERGIMTPEVQEAVLRRAFAEARDGLNLIYQGGEPTLAGVNYFLRAAELEKALNQRGIPVTHSIQTNGLSLNGEWISLFRQERYLVGLSLDGPRELHDRNRVDFSGDGSYSGAIRALRLLRKEKIDFNVLAVVTASSARHPDAVYGFFRREQADFMQFIPCLEPLKGESDIPALTGKQWGDFLCRIFDLWWQDISSGKRISVRLFDNLLAMAEGYPPESCGMSGICVNQNVVEADGSVYPCDFWALDEWKLGNLVSDSLSEIAARYAASGFEARSRELPPECRTCPYGRFCGGGCFREREQGRYRFCEDWKRVLDYVMPRLTLLLR